MENKYDVHSEEDLKAHCAKTEEIADQYRVACEDFSSAKINLDKKLVACFKAGTIKESMAYEKALPLVASMDAEAQADYEVYVNTEMLRKGLETVITARSQTITLHQSLMKNRAAQKV